MSIDRPADELSVHDTGGDGLGAEEIATLELTEQEAIKLDSLHDVGPSRSLGHGRLASFRAQQAGHVRAGLVVFLASSCADRPLPRAGPASS